MRKGELMKSDAEIRDDIIDEVQRDPQLTAPEAIGVAVTDGAVTLTGQILTYVEKLAATQAAERVYGVRAVANDLMVKWVGAPRDDSDIAAAIMHFLEWNVHVPEGRVGARVEDGWATLDGEVEYDFQRREAERMVRQVRGVIGVTDTIAVKPPATAQALIKETVTREEAVDAAHQGCGRRAYRENQSGAATELPK